MLDTWTSFALVSQPETTPMTRRGQPAEQRGEQVVDDAPDTAGVPRRQHELPDGRDPGGRVGLGQRRGEPGAGEPVAALRVVLGAQADRDADA